ncbi:MAG: hypothetical protein AAGF07_02295 [Patescibacteria group bacterium]
MFIFAIIAFFTPVKQELLTEKLVEIVQKQYLESVDVPQPISENHLTIQKLQNFTQETVRHLTFLILSCGVFFLVITWLYSSVGIILFRLGVLPSSMYVRSVLNQLSNVNLGIVLLIQFVGIYLLSIKTYRLSSTLFLKFVKIPINAFYGLVYGFLIGCISLVMINNLLPEEVTKSRIFNINEVEEIVLLDNDLCSDDRYQIVQRQDSQASLEIRGNQEQIDNLELNISENKAELTNMYSLQTCWLNRDEVITVLINTPNLIPVQNQINGYIITDGFKTS